MLNILGVLPLQAMKNYLSLIKFSHTIFALPFAMVGFFLGVQAVGSIDYRLLGLVVLCMIFARSAAMAFNRFIDRDIDILNDRTAKREIPAGIVKPKNALMFVIVNSLLLIITTYFINPLCFYLSPIALFITLGYSYTKRFTALCHFVLGLGLSLAPVGAYLAVTGEFQLIPVLYGLVVLFWVAGFDIIYALQDVDFDAENRLHSIPTFLGKEKALILSKVLHFLVSILMIGAAYFCFQLSDLISWIHWVAVGVFLGLLFYQHTLVKANDLTKVNLAFFTTNGMASAFFGILFVLDYFV